MSDDAEEPVPPVVTAGLVSVAIPTLNAGEPFREVLAAVRRQDICGEVELVVCDSGSTDRTVDVAREFGAEVIAIDRSEFSHGATRNLLMARSSGAVVLFLTQDAVPADEGWARRAVEIFGSGRYKDAALVHGPYLPNPSADPHTARELTEFFASFSPAGEAEFRAAAGSDWASVSSRESFFTSANGGVRRDAWVEVPFPNVPYAEDRLLALRMLEAGYSKVYSPGFAVFHSHRYSSWELFGRYFDEFRGLREAFGYREPLGVRRTLGRIAREAGRDSGWVAARSGSRSGRTRSYLGGVRHHSIRAAGSIVGSRSDRLSPSIRRRLSLEGRASFLPVDRSAT